MVVLELNASMFLNVVLLACPANCLKCTEKTDGSGTECMADQCEDKYTLKAADKTCRG